MRSLKRMTAFIAAAVIMLAAVPTVFATEQKNGIDAKLFALRTVYDTGSYFTASGNAAPSSDWQNASSMNADSQLAKIPARGGLPAGSEVGCTGTSCYAFAQYCFYYIFGHNFNTEVFEVQKPTVGDALVFPGHYAIYLSEDEDNYYVYDANWDRLCGVRFNGRISKSKYSSVQILRSKNYASVYDGKDLINITYDANGGTNPPIADKALPDVPFMITKNQPEREGYIFIGWSLDNTAHESEIKSESVFCAEEDCTLYAVWMRNSTTVFCDVFDEWYKQYIDYCCHNKILSGISESEFSPQSNLTRAQLVQVLANLSGVDTSDRNVESGFSDVASGVWYTPAIKWAYENKIVSGMGEGVFAPDSNVTREQMCVMLINYAAFCKIEFEPIESERFDDHDKISEWAKTAVYLCKAAEVIRGKGENTFDPLAGATRAEAAVVFTIFHKLYKNSVSFTNSRCFLVVFSVAYSREVSLTPRSRTQENDSSALNDKAHALPRNPQARAATSQAYS